MISFIRPSFLGTVKEFRNRFVNPIDSALTRDADAAALRLSKQRMHVRHCPAAPTYGFLPAGPAVLVPSAQHPPTSP